MEIAFTWLTLKKYKYVNGNIFTGKNAKPFQAKTPMLALCLILE